MPWNEAALAACLGLALTACAGKPLTGPLSPADLPSFDAKWEAASAQANPSPEASRALARVGPGAGVLVVLGTWCSDSRREVSRFIKALELAGDVPFEVRWIGVDRRKEAAGLDARALDIRFVPTFIVSRNGKEIGRVVESSPEGIEKDVGSLLREEKRGEISARAPEPAPH